MLEVDTEKNNEKIYDVDEEINTIQTAIRRKRHKNEDYRELFPRLVEFKISKFDLKNKIKALKQINSHIEEVKDEVKLKIKQLQKEN